MWFTHCINGSQWKLFIHALSHEHFSDSHTLQKPLEFSFLLKWQWGLRDQERQCVLKKRKGKKGVFSFTSFLWECNANYSFHFKTCLISILIFVFTFIWFLNIFFNDCLVFGNKNNIKNGAINLNTADLNVNMATIIQLWRLIVLQRLKKKWNAFPPKTAIR